MSIQDLPPEFEQVLNRLLNSRNDEIPAADFEAFQQILASHPEAIQEYFDYLDVDLGIQSHLAEYLQTLEGTASGETIPEPEVAVAAAVGNRSPLINYLVVAAASLLLVLMLEWMTSGDFLWDPTPEQITEQPVPKPAYVATLTRSTDCVWGGKSLPQFAGQRLLSENLILEQGVAEFRFDTGVRLIIEGPTKIDLVTACCAKLDYGKMVLHGYEPSPEFSLITPLLTFHDIGTEYGAEIHKDGEVELHVFEGAVRVDPNQKNDQFAESLIIEAGQARHLNDKISDDIQLQPEIFKREVPGAPQQFQSQRQALQSYDSFHPPEISEPEQASKWQDTGFGWSGPWRNEQSSSERAEGISQPRKSLTRTEVAPSQLGLVEIRKGNTVWRTLEKPVRMDTNAIYYLSFYIKKLNSVGRAQEFGNLSLNASVKQEHPRKILFGMSSINYAILQADMQIIETAPPLQTGETYLFVAKIVASEKASDQVFLRAFSSAENIPDQEPPVWTSATVPFQASNVFDLVRLHAGKKGDYLFDELRIGSTWSSVTNPDLPRLILEQQK